MKLNSKKVLAPITALAILASLLTSLASPASATAPWGSEGLFSQLGTISCKGDVSIHLDDTSAFDDTSVIDTGSLVVWVMDYDSETNTNVKWPGTDSTKVNDALSAENGILQFSTEDSSVTTDHINIKHSVKIKILYPHGTDPGLTIDNFSCHKYSAPAVPATPVVAQPTFTG